MQNAVEASTIAGLRDENAALPNRSLPKLSGRTIDRLSYRFPKLFAALVAAKFIQRLQKLRPDCF
jgi:hypothetical protein